MTPIAASLAGAALAALALAASAGATNVVRIASSVTIKSDSLHFHGRVRSDNPACEQGRKVLLFRVIHGGPDQKLEKDRTNSHGRWGMTPQGFAGISMSHFYAKAKKRREGTAGTIFVCQGARSEKIRPSP